MAVRQLCTDGNQVSLTALPILQRLTNRGSKSLDQVSLRLIILTERGGETYRFQSRVCTAGFLAGIRSCSITLAATRLPE